jgi:hypothetical protein
MARIVITLGESEQEALVRLALREVRTPRDQARYILRRELIERGEMEESNLPKVAEPVSEAVGDG